MLGHRGARTAAAAVRRAATLGHRGEFLHYRHDTPATRRGEAANVANPRLVEWPESLSPHARGERFAGGVLAACAGVLTPRAR